jgi:hypothetical protein
VARPATGGVASKAIRCHPLIHEIIADLADILNVPQHEIVRLMVEYHDDWQHRLRKELWYEQRREGG